MLKLPKGLKKKKKKSKKNQELFTEEELEQFKREQRARQLAEQQQQEGEDEQDDDNSVHKQQQPQQQHQQQQHQQQPHGESEKAKTDDDEWLKFKSLTTGIDTVLKKTQGNLDRIKESSFFQRIEPPKPKLPEPKAEEPVATSSNDAAGTSAEDQKLAELQSAVIELSESEEESDDGDDIFDTNYIDSLTGVLAYVPDSPEEIDDGPDPFDTAYADKVIKGPEVSKRGKKIVHIGAAVEVLTGRVEKVNVKALKRPRRGIQNLLLESFDKDLEESRADGGVDIVVDNVPIHTLLDDPAEDELPDIPIDLSTSLLLQFQPPKSESFEPFSLEPEKDEFDDLAAESLTKKEEIVVLQEIVQDPVPITDTCDWEAFEGEPHPADIVDIDDLDIPADDDIFDTTYVGTVIKESIDDDDFDPRADEEPAAPPSVAVVRAPQQSELKVQLPDLLSGSTTDLTDLSHVPVISASESIEVEYDPFDTSAVSSLVQPKAAEIKFLEKELLTDSFLKHSISDPDFDPRGDEQLPPPLQTVSERKSSLSLNIAAAGAAHNNKSVGFSIPSGLSVLNTHTNEGKVQKPLTPYYSVKSFEEATDVIEEDIADSDFNPRGGSEEVKPDLLAVSVSHNIKVLTPSTSIDQSQSIADPFDTSNVSSVLVPGKTELKLLENELIESREPDKTAVLDTNTDSQELGLGDKVLTPHVCESQESLEDIDPFDTSFANNIAPGQAEIKLLESELIHK